MELLATKFFLYLFALLGLFYTLDRLRVLNILFMLFIYTVFIYALVLLVCTDFNWWTLVMFVYLLIVMIYEATKPRGPICPINTNKGY
jgi:hypothetical protein